MARRQDFGAGMVQLSGMIMTERAVGRLRCRGAGGKMRS